MNKKDYMGFKIEKCNSKDVKYRSFRKNGRG